MKVLQCKAEKESAFFFFSFFLSQTAQDSGAYLDSLCFSVSFFGSCSVSKVTTSDGGHPVVARGSRM